MEYVDKPVCDSCGGLYFEIVEMEKLEPEIRYVQASQYYQPADYFSVSTATFSLPELTTKAICIKCRREYLY